MTILSCLRVGLAPLDRNARAVTRDRRGITALEYGLAAALVALVIIGGANTFGTNVSSMFTNLGSSVSGVTTTVP